jgi:hypothetical protein
VLVLLSVILFTQVITLTFWLFTLEFQEVQVLALLYELVHHFGFSLNRGLLFQLSLH